MGRKGGYVTVQEWMLDLGLRPSELLAYALIYGYSQDGRSSFQGTTDYVAYWLGLTHQGALGVLKSLTEKGLVTRSERRTGAIKRVEYRAADESRKFTRSESRKFTGASKETLPVASKETLPNNTIYNTNNNNGVTSIFDR